MFKNILLALGVTPKYGHKLNKNIRQFGVAHEI